MRTLVCSIPKTIACSFARASAFIVFRICIRHFHLRFCAAPWKFHQIELRFTGFDWLSLQSIDDSSDITISRASSMVKFRTSSNRDCIALSFNQNTNWFRKTVFRYSPKLQVIASLHSAIKYSLMVSSGHSSLCFLLLKGNSPVSPRALDYTELPAHEQFQRKFLFAVSPVSGRMFHLS